MVEGTVETLGPVLYMFIYGKCPHVQGMSEMEEYNLLQSITINHDLNPINHDPI
jgi:hypothetical protein